MNPKCDTGLVSPSYVGLRTRSITGRGGAQALSAEPTAGSGLGRRVPDGNLPSPQALFFAHSLQDMPAVDLTSVKSTGDTEVCSVLCYLPLRVLHTQLG